MDLVERYVHAIGVYLPRAQRDDIVTELAEDLRSQIDDREAQLGRALTEEEIEAILVQRGHPLRVATQYFPQRSLVGPALLPIYYLVLKIVLATVVGAFALVIIPTHVFQGAGFLDALLQSLAALLPAIWISIGIVTVVFALLERSQIATIATSWSPRRLPRVHATGDPNVISRSEAIAQVVLTAVFALWWLSGAPLPVIVTAPLWRTLTHEAYLPVLLLALGSFALAEANVLRPYWTPLRLGARAALDGLGAAVAFVVLQVNWAQVTADVRVATNASASPEALTNAGIDLIVALSLGIAGVVMVVTCGVYAVRCGSRLIAPQRSAPQR
jgi:hypothetical protein